MGWEIIWTSRRIPTAWIRLIRLRREALLKEIHWILSPAVKGRADMIVYDPPPLVNEAHVERWSSSLTFREHQSLFAELSRSFKVADAWIRFHIALQKTPLQKVPVPASEPLRVNVPAQSLIQYRFMRLWINRAPIQWARWYIHLGIPFFILHVPKSKRSSDLPLPHPGYSFYDMSETEVMHSVEYNFMEYAARKFGATVEALSHTRDLFRFREGRSPWNEGDARASYSDSCYYGLEYGLSEKAKAYP
jgi:hypothetical protein